LLCSNRDGTAETKGPCGPAVTGNNKQFTISCQGITKEQGAEFLKILNKISRDQLDPNAVMAKLSEIEQEVQGVAKSIPRSRIMSDKSFNLFVQALNKARAGYSRGSSWLYRRHRGIGEANL
jgi:hypothetical protein